MSSPSEREAALRRALLSAAEQIEPAPGGLELIQARLRRPRPALVAWAEAAWTVLVMRAPDAAEAVRRRAEAVRRRAENVLRLVWARFGPRPAPGPGPHWLSWLRPLVAMSVAVFVIGAGVYIGLANPASIFNTNGVGLGSPGAGGSHASGPAQSGGATTDGKGHRSPYSSVPSSPGTSKTCSPSATPYNSGHPSTATPILSSPPTPTPTGTSTSPSPSPSPSPSDTGSSTPASSTTPASGTSVAIPNAGTGSSAGTSSSANATLSAALSSATVTKLPSSKSHKNSPCQTTKQKGKRRSKTSLTSALLAGAKPAQAQSAGVVAAKPD